MVGASFFGADDAVKLRDGSATQGNKLWEHKLHPVRPLRRLIRFRLHATPHWRLGVNKPLKIERIHCEQAYVASDPTAHLFYPPRRIVDRLKPWALFDCGELSFLFADR